MRYSVVLALAFFLQGQSTDSLRKGFLEPPDDARPMVRWWWFGPSVTNSQLERELRLMKEGGFGGFEVQPTYPLAPDDWVKGIRNLPFLSQPFLDALRFTSDKAAELGLRFDLTLGSGWPFGGPSVSIDQAAGRLRVEKVQPKTTRVPLPDLSSGERFIAAFEGGSTRELTNIRDGVLWLPQSYSGEVWFFIASRTGQMVKRASVGAEGYVLDHYSREAAQHYLDTVGAPLLKSLPKPPHAIFCDSLELFGSDWTPDLLDEFRKRRGYDLRPLLPALVSDIGPKTRAIRHDWGLTLTELVEERFLSPLQRWSKANNTQLRIQNYGIPPVVLSSNAYSDLPEGEGFQWKVVRASRWASSASHIYGRPVTSSETWTWLHTPVFRATPLDMKAEADIHFLQGITQLIGHGWPYTAEGVGYPGWRFYAAAVFNDKNPWWIVMPDVNRYLQRVSFMLRQGEAANDVAFYLPNHDAWGDFSAGKVHMIEALRARLGMGVISQVLDSGYGFDFFDDTILAKLGSVEGKMLRLGASRYRAVVIPPVDSMPVDTLRRLQEFSRSGGILLAVGHGPSQAPGTNASDADHTQIREITSKLSVVSENELGSALAKSLTPDMTIEPANPAVGFIHRVTTTSDIYFIANTSNQALVLNVRPRVTGRNPELWNAMTGEMQRVSTIKAQGAVTSIQLDLAPYESKLVIFTNHNTSPTRSVAASGPRATDLSGGWSMAFPDQPPTPITRFQSWTEDEQTRYFSGVVTYTRSVDMTSDALSKNVSVILDFGEATPLAAKNDSGKRADPGFRTWLDAPVKEAAVVFVNGKRAGSVWAPPYRLDITSFLKTGRNELRIEVANLAVNDMAGRPATDYRLLNSRYGVRFEAQDMDQIRPEPSGLFGAIRLLFVPPPPHKQSAE